MLNQSEYNPDYALHVYNRRTTQDQLNYKGLSEVIYNQIQHLIWDESYKNVTNYVRAKEEKARGGSGDLHLVIHHN